MLLLCEAAEGETAIQSSAYDGLVTSVEYYIVGEKIKIFINHLESFLYDVPVMLPQTIEMEFTAI